MTNNHTAMAELEAGLSDIRKSPKDEGIIELIACRPEVGERRILATGELDSEQGLLGDNWKKRGSDGTKDGSAHPQMQLNLMNTRVIRLMADEQSRWMLAGDQFYVDFDLSPENVPPGTQLALGTAVIEVTAAPHLGCKKFAQRYGLDAARFVNSAVGKSLNLRGINAKVVSSGSVTTGAVIKKLRRNEA